MKQITKIVRLKSFVLPLLAVMLLSFGCGRKQAAAPHIVLKWWKPFEDSQNIQPLIFEYQKKHPNVEIQYSKKNIETYESDLLDALAAGQGPDIFSINNAWLPKYLDKTAAAKQDASFNFASYKDTFVDTVVQDYTKDQQIYGVALNVDSLALYYNKDLLGTVGIATPPKTWDELAKDVRRLTRQDQTGYFTESGVAMGLSSNVNRAVDIVYLLMLQAGSLPWSQDGQNPQFTQNIQRNGNFVSPGVDALTFYTSFANPNSANYNWNTRSDYSIDSFANGRSAMLYSYSYTAATVKQKSPNLNFDVAPVPQFDLNGTSVNFANYFGEVVNKQSQNTDAAWDFLKFISSKDALDKYYAQDKLPSSRKDMIAQQIQDPEIGVFAHANLTAKPFYRPDQAKMDNIFTNLIDNITLRGMRVQDALSSAESQARTLVRR